MRFTEQALDELRAIVRDEFQEDITRDQAADVGTRLVGLVRLLLRPLPDEEHRPTDRRR